ncbi:PhnD/SsuA/transferrin family substrate-binding protein [Halarcobacter sp.]|uniref:phosphate/phosphite/phosphonate ABC transporter substrate-binding protein n=1 Tax=Halarcobacter sp. TaxID=2321133 RepID=UPI002AA61D9C|nr:PhnD/SsuA/transferrin family substrate-binding protein [Halarcobacter sp.]
MKLIKLILLFSFFSIFCVADSLKIGVTPYTNALKIIKIYKPLTDFLTKELNTNVEVYTSSNYKKFYEDVESGDFDLIVTSPHFGALHIQNGFIPIYRYNTSLDLLIIVLKDSPYKKISDLKNTTIATPDYLAALNIGGVKTLLDNGLIEGKNFKLEDLGSHTSAIKSVLLKTTDASITTYSPLKQFSDKELLKKIRILESDFKMPHLFTLANPKLNKNKINQIKEKLKKFEKSSEGKIFFKKTGYKGYINISKEDIESLLTVSKDTKKYLGIK